MQKLVRYLVIAACAALIGLGSAVGSQRLTAHPPTFTAYSNPVVCGGGG